MRSLWRNTIPVWYAKYKGVEMTTDEYGLYTTEYEVTYEDPVEIRANVSPARQIVHPAFFGTDVSYDKTLSLSDPDLDITENSVIWIKTQPVQENGKTVTPYEYIVKKISKWKNSLVIAIKEVDVSED